MIQEFVSAFVLLLLLSHSLFQSQPSISMVKEEPEIVISASEASSSHDTTAAYSSTTVTKKRSLVWAYFRESSIQKEAICNLCEGKVSTCGNTTNMVKVSYFNDLVHSILGWSLYIVGVFMSIQ